MNCVILNVSWFALPYFLLHIPQPYFHSYASLRDILVAMLNDQLKTSKSHLCSVEVLLGSDLTSEFRIPLVRPYVELAFDLAVTRRKRRNMLELSFEDERIRSQTSTPTENIHSNPALLNKWRKYIEPLSDSDASTGSVEDSPVRWPKLRLVKQHRRQILIG